MSRVGPPALALLLVIASVGSVPVASDVPPARMRAVVHREFGGPEALRLEDVDKPAPGDGQILVRVHAASVNPLDWHTLEGLPFLARPLAFGFLRPSDTRLGVDFAGTVEAVGRNVTSFKPGDEVFGGRTGAFAEYVAVPADRAVVLKPANLTFEEAAAVPVAAVTALQALRDHGKLQRGQKVLINGASGGVGTFAVQLAATFGADVTGVCSTRNVELVRGLGARNVIDYTKQDFTELPERYDLVIDNVGNRSLSEFRRVLAPRGRYVVVGGGGLGDNPWTGPLLRFLKAQLMSRFSSQELQMMIAQLDPKDLRVLADLLAARKIRPVIDRRYPLGDVRQAMAYLEQGHARGKVVLDLDDTSAGPTDALAKEGKRTPSGLVALVLVGVLAGVTLGPLVAALALDRRFRRRNPGSRPFRWGYYFSLLSAIAGFGLGAAFESGAVATLACGGVYVVLAWLFARRHRWAWIALTVLSFNPVVWIVNAVYLYRRWGETAVVR